MRLEPQAGSLEVRVDLVEVKKEMPLPPARRQQPLADDAAEVLGARADADALRRRHRRERGRVGELALVAIGASLQKQMPFIFNKLREIALNWSDCK